MKNKNGGNNDLLYVVNKIKVMSFDNVIFVEDGTDLENYGEGQPVGRPPELHASGLDVKTEWWRDERPPEDHVGQHQGRLRAKYETTDDKQQDAEGDRASCGGSVRFRSEPLLRDGLKIRRAVAGWLPVFIYTMRTGTLDSLAHFGLAWTTFPTCFYSLRTGGLACSPRAKWSLSFEETTKAAADGTK